jgi:hypothetical protein
MGRVQMAAVMTQSVILNATECAACGVVFAMPADLEEARRRDRGAFYCPNGHNLHYSEHPDRIALREERERIARMQVEREKLTQALAEERAAAERLSNDLLDKAKEVRSLKARANAGVCAQCNRQFQNVARHVKSKHEHIPQPPKPPAKQGARA